MTASAYREKHTTAVYRERVLIKCNVQLDAHRGNDQGHAFTRQTGAPAPRRFVGCLRFTPNENPLTLLQAAL